jgi:hypothetical protein
MLNRYHQVEKNPDLQICHSGTTEAVAARPGDFNSQS